VQAGEGASWSGARSVIYGLIAAIGWGASAIAATNAARRAGTYIAVLSGQGVGVVALVLLAAFLLGVTLIIAGLVLIGLGRTYVVFPSSIPG
jgi:hypothetical protein